MASSTTKPIASTNPKSDSVLMEKPSRGNTANVPISETGTANSGISAARQPCRKMKTTNITRPSASQNVLPISLDSFCDRLGRVDGDLVVQVGRKALLQLRHEPFHAFGRIDGIGAGKLVQGQDGRRLAVESAHDVVIRAPNSMRATSLNRTIEPFGRGAKNDVREFVFGNEPALCADGISEFLAGGLGRPPSLPAGLTVF